MRPQHTRRDFVRMGIATTGAAMFPSSIMRALAIPANRATGTIQDVEHVVILMQENRSFDHYFGSLRGVRGFNDPRPHVLTSGKPVWYQPTASIKTQHYHDRGLAPEAEHVLPWYLNPKRTTEYQAGTDHGWSSGHLAWNHGRWDQWVTQKQDVLTMGHLTRRDVSFHYALADAFTVCDSYFCSAHADTLINRIYLWTGTSDPRNVFGRKPNGPALQERLHVNGYTWTTYPERLEANKVSWRVYQGGTGIPGTPTDNYTDNSLEFFAQYQVQEGASPDSPLVRNGVSTHTLEDLRSDVEQGQLPQVSWIVAPYLYCEHPDASPTHGAYYIDRVLKALTSNPEVWSKTVLLINYDENDGLFDHVVPPMPPHTQAMNSQGRVSDDLVESLKDEFIDLDKYPTEMHPLVPGADPGGLQPIGLGPRVPMLVISPWSKGGWVCSETFDHTSVLRFLDARFGVPEPNISRWRKAICGDLTSAFDFSRAADVNNVSLRVPKPIHSKHKPYHVPDVQRMPVQESGTRPARPLAYDFTSQIRNEGGKIWVDFINKGKIGAAFYVYNGCAPESAARRYAVSAERTLSDYWEPAQSCAAYDLLVYGPNGYVAHFRGGRSEDEIEARIRYDRVTKDIVLVLTNRGLMPCTVVASNRYANRKAGHYTIAAEGTSEERWRLAGSASWFDLSVTNLEDTIYLRRFAGHVETGRPSTSDPASYLD